MSVKINNSLSIPYKDTTLSVIIRSHNENRLSLLDEALFSLAIQYWNNIEVVVVLQNGTEQFKSKVLKLIEKQPFHTQAETQVHIVSIPPDVDGRSILLNYGIKSAKGKYIAFLDDDDYVYQHGYHTLIDQLQNSTCCIAIGGCRTAQVINNSEYFYIEKKGNPFKGNKKLDLIIDNFIPIHSYVIDRSRVDDSELYFDERFSLLEDYEFLLRLASKYEFDFTKFNTIVCEYRLHSDNSLPFVNELTDKHNAALQCINDRKKHMNFSLPIEKLKQLIESQDYSLRIEPPSQDYLIVEASQPNNDKILRRVLNTTGDKVYLYFNKHPLLEKRASALLHFIWNQLKKDSVHEK